MNVPQRRLSLCLVLAAAALYGPSVIAAPDASAPAAAAETNGKLHGWLALAEQMVEAAPKVRAIWPGYWPEKQAFIIYAADTGALLVSDQPGPPSFAPLSTLEIPPPLKGKVWFHKGALEGVNRPFLIDYPTRGGRTAILAAAVDDAAKMRAVLYHEQFHGFQADRFKGKHAGQFIAPTAVADRVSFAAAAETERRILAAAFSAKGKQQNRLLRDYLAARRAREAQLTPKVVGVERGFETYEGTAKFVEKAAEAHFSPGAPLSSLLINELRTDLSAQRGPYMSIWFRSRGYSVGAALCYFLEALDPRGWRARVEAGEPLDEQVARLVNYKPEKNGAARVAALRSRYGYQDLLARMGPGIRAAEEKEIKTADDFYKLGPYRVVLHIPSGGAKDSPKPSMGFNSGPAGMALISDRELVLPLAEVANVKGPFGSLTVKKRPFMSDSSSGHRYVALLGSAPRINGKLMAEAGEYRFDKVEVTGEGLELKVDAPAIVTVSAEGITIRVNR